MPPHSSAPPLLLPSSLLPNPLHNHHIISTSNWNFGAAEGKRWSFRDYGSSKSIAEYMSEDKYPVLLPGERFPGGESDEDLAARAAQAVDELIMPHVRSAMRTEHAEHTVLVTHGLFTGVLIAALLKKDSSGALSTREYTGVQNTVWARVVITLQMKEYPLIVKVTDTGRADHLITLKSNARGTGKVAYDPKQQDIRDFFSGAATIATEHCESNAQDKTKL